MKDHDPVFLQPSFFAETVLPSLNRFARAAISVRDLRQLGNLSQAFRAQGLHQQAAILVGRILQKTQADAESRGVAQHGLFDRLIERAIDSMGPVHHFAEARLPQEPVALAPYSLGTGSSLRVVNHAAGITVPKPRLHLWSYKSRLVMIGPVFGIGVIKEINHGSGLRQSFRKPRRASGIVHRHNLCRFQTVFPLQILTREHGRDDAIKAREVEVDGEGFGHSCTYVYDTTQLVWNLAKTKANHAARAAKCDSLACVTPLPNTRAADTRRGDPQCTGPKALRPAF